MTEISLHEYANKQRSTSSKQSPLPHIGLIIGAGVLIAGLSFIGGMQYQKSKTPVSTTATSSRYTAPGGFGGGFRRGDRAFGTVTAISSSSISVKTREGSTDTYAITSSTTVTDNGQSSTVGDIQTGDIVILTLSSSNAKDVSSIMLNPNFGGFGGGFGGSPGSAGSQTNSGSNTSSNAGSSTTTSGA